MQWVISELDPMDNDLTSGKPLLESKKDEILRLGFDTLSAQKAAADGEIEAWVHRYLTTGRWANPAFSQGLKRQKRWWVGPVEVDVSALTRCVGTEPGMEFPVTDEYWERRAREMLEGMGDPLSLPPLIVEYRAGELSVRDGNTRLKMMELLGWPKCWVILWYNSAEDYREHSAEFI